MLQKYSNKNFDNYSRNNNIKKYSKTSRRKNRLTNDSGVDTLELRRPNIASC